MYILSLKGEFCYLTKTYDLGNKINASSKSWSIKMLMLNVPDKRSRILEVVIVRRLLTWVLGIWSGEGMGRVKKREVSLRVTWDRGGRILSQKEGFQVSKGE